MDPPDSPNPTQDIIAAYVRTGHRITGFEHLFDLQNRSLPYEIQIRLDFLDLVIRNNCDVYLALDYQPGGTSNLPGGNRAQIDWDTLVILPSFGPIQAWDAQNQAVLNLSIYTVRDPVLDTLQLNLDASKLPGAMAGIGVQAVLTEPGSDKITDQLNPFQLGDRPPQIAPVLFAFWNTFPAYTPAQSLRRWDGAHTGPMGGRHGLYNLLRAARNYQIPLALLDLKSPVSLSALDYVDGLPIVQRMAAEDLLILPDHVPPIESNFAMPEEFISMAANASRQTSLAFHLPATPFLFTPLDNDLPRSYPVVLTNMPSINQVGYTGPGMGRSLRWREKTVFAIPNELLTEQTTVEGLSLDTRKALVWTALMNASQQALGESIFMTLGGDLPNSEWGVPQFARAGFRYLRAHPWIRPLYAHDLLGTRPKADLAVLQKSFSAPGSTWSGTMDNFLSQSIARLSHLPPSTINQDAWQFLFSLYAPQYPHPSELDDLRSIYLGQAGVLLYAANWASNPFITSTCGSDLDLDGRAECLLTSEDVFAAFDGDTGTLTHLFIKTPSGFHQVIAPTSQFVVGLSESSSWNLDEGFSADPAVIPGAFAIDDQPMQPMLSGDKLSFSSNGIEVVYHLTSNGLSLEYRTNHEISTQIPLALDPWMRYTPAWGEHYIGNDSVLGWTWMLESGPRVEIRTDAKLTASPFNETRKMMATTENPNAEFPPSHFLPFPLAVLTLEAAGDFFVDILLTD
jgi:hypothetical protein